MEKDFYLIKGDIESLFLSIFIIALGFIIMSGGESSDPDIFNDEIYNFSVLYSHLMVVLGLHMYISILYKDKK